MIDYGTGTSSILTLSEGALAQYSGQSATGQTRVPVTVSGVPGSILADAMAGIAGSGFASSVTAFLGPVADYNDMVDLVGATIGGQDYIFAAARTGAGIDIFSATTGAPILLDHRGDTPTSYADGISTMATIQIGARSFLITGSETESGVTTFEIGPTGHLTEVASLGIGELIPIAAVSEIRTIGFDGQTYLLAASAGSSSLTVFDVAANGTLSVTDHVVDDLATRFQGVTAMDVASVAGRVFVVAAGADGGISLLTMIPGGKLIHLQSLSDTQSAVLANVSAISMVVVGNELQVFVTSAAESGVSQFRISLTSLGATMHAGSGPLVGTALDDMLSAGDTGGSVSGGGGQDILLDGAGADTLWGGAGSDTFILAEDGVDDVLGDFQPGVDRIDLSCYAYLRSLDQLVFQPISGGVVIHYGNERLTVYTTSGRSLTAADFQSGGLLNLTRFPVEAGIPTVDPSVPEPTPPQTPAGYTVVQGTNGANILWGTPADEQILGWAGNDTLIGGGGADQFFGGSGMDVVSYVGATAAVRVDLMSAASNEGAAAGQTFYFVEGIYGTAFADTLSGDGADNQLCGFGGADALFGRAGDDVLEGGGGADTVFGGAGHDTVSGDDGADRLIGDGGNDTLFGNGGNDTLLGGADHDQLHGGVGFDRL
ncbi:MAG: hypothetical protein KDE08_04225, partial [Rhodobacteraceae bacterium]|nr:hypothetical protein [Paracoccaceae bacterium]